MLLVERTHDLLELLSKLECAELCRVAETVHHVGYAAELESLPDNLKAVLEQAYCVAGVNSELHHAVIAAD